MKKKKWLISVIIVIILIISIGIFVYNFINDEKKLTSEERTWIDNNINNVQNVYVIKDENIFAQDGHGVFYKFLEDFQKEYGININIINKDENTKDEGISLDNTNEIVRSFK